MMEIFVTRLCQCQYSGHDIMLYIALLMYYTSIMYATNGGNWVGKGVLDICIITSNCL